MVTVVTSGNSSPGQPTKATKLPAVRIAIVNSFYRSKNPSGENFAVELQAEALSVDNEVRIFAKSTDDEQLKPHFPISSASRVAFGIGGSFLEEIQNFKPDIVHIHNLFPNLGWRWLSKIDVPVVVTLHNYRTFCAAGTAMLGDKSCTLCQTHGSYNAVINKCYRGSGIASVPLAIQNHKPFLDNPVISAATGLVLLSPRMEAIFAPLGLSQKRYAIIPNFVPSPPSVTTAKNGRWAWIGRLSPEKGLDRLLSDWPIHHKLDVFGDGPLRSTLERHAPTTIKFMGLVPQERLRTRLPSYNGVIISSQWPEAAINMVHLLAMSVGLPVVTTPDSTSADEVTASGFGSIYHSRGQLGKALEYWSSRPDQSKLIVERFETHFSEKSWGGKMNAFYSSLLQ